MLVVNFSTIRDNFEDCCDKAIYESEAVIVTREDEKNLALISLNEYDLLTKAARKADYL